MSNTIFRSPLANSFQIGYTGITILYKGQMTMSVLNVTVETFEAEVLKNPKPVLVDFWAPWCGPCKMVGPILEEIAADRDDIVVAKVNVDDNMALAKQYRIISIPTMMLMKNGEIAKKLVGFHEREEIEEILYL